MRNAKMYLASILLCVLISCKGDQGPVGPQGPEGDPGSQGAAASYTAGEGVSISNSTISVLWGGGGAATTVARADHDHDARYTPTATLASYDGDGPNQGSNLVHWSRLVGVPTGFADGVDDAGSGSYAAGSGISISGNVISTALSTDDGDAPNQGSNLVHWSRLTGVPAGFADGSDDAPLADGSVTTAKLANAAVTTEKLASGAVGFEVLLGSPTDVTVPAGSTVAATPTCPTGYRAISGGWNHTGGSRQLFVTVSLPPTQNNPNAWELDFYTPEAGGATARAWAVCARVTP